MPFADSAAAICSGVEFAPFGSIAATPGGTPGGKPFCPPLLPVEPELEPESEAGPEPEPEPNPEDCPLESLPLPLVLLIPEGCDPLASDDAGTPGWPGIVGITPPFISSNCICCSVAYFVLPMMLPAAFT